MTAFHLRSMMVVLLLACGAATSFTVRVNRVLVEIDLPNDALDWMSVFARVRSATGHRRFSLRAEDGTVLTRHTFRAASHLTATLQLDPANASSPANCVDPFWASERTAVPQLRGLAARWYWPKALTGNTHPGPSLPHGFVSATAYSGAYPSGYGVNSPSTSGAPSALLEGNYTKQDEYASVPYQYSTTGFAHFQASGTGSIGNYMNYVRVMPLAVGVEDFIARGAPWGERRTIVGERARPGWYQATLGESGLRAELTTTATVALHRYTLPSGARGGKQLSLALDMTAAGLLMSGHTQPFRGVNVTVAPCGARFCISGVLHTPPPTNHKRTDDDGLQLFVAVELGDGIVPASSFPLVEGIATANAVTDSVCVCTDLTGSWGRPEGHDDDAYLLAVMSDGDGFTVTSKHPGSWRQAIGTCNGAGNITIHFDNGHTNTGTCTVRSDRSDGGDRANLHLHWSDGTIWVDKGGGSGGGNASFAIVMDEQGIAAAGGAVGVACAVREPTDPSTTDTVAELRIAFSLRSVSDAQASLGALSSQTFDAVADAAWSEWDVTLGRIAVLDDSSVAGAMRERELFYSVLFHALRKPIDASAVVPDSWAFGAATTNSDQRSAGYVFDLATMWDQHKTTLPLILSVYPSMGRSLLRGLIALARRFTEFPNGYTLDTATNRFDDQARGLAHHTLADGLYRNYTNVTIDWDEALALMARTFDNTTDGIAFVRDGVTEKAHATHTLDLAGAAFATARVARRYGRNTSAALALAARMERLSQYSLHAYDNTTCLLHNSSEYGYYEGTYMNYGFRPLAIMKQRIALCGSGDNDSAVAEFVRLMDAFFGYGRDAVVQLPIKPAQEGSPGWISDVAAQGMGSHTYEGLCNEPDMETPYTYAYARRADRVQEVVRAVKAYSFAPGRGGLVGNDDSGGEAAWFVWASIGIMPIAGQPVYIIGSPSFSAVEVRLFTGDTDSDVDGGDDKLLRIQRVGAGAYIQSGTFDGVDLNGRAWLWVHELHQKHDSVLRLLMGGAPNSNWGSVPPPSF